MTKPTATRYMLTRHPAAKHVATLGAVVLATLFVVVFFASRVDSQALDAVAPRAGMNPEDLLAMAPRIASQSGVTLGSSRRIVYLLACSGMASKDTLEAQALQAGTLAKQRRLTDREAVAAALDPGTGSLNDC